MWKLAVAAGLLAVLVPAGAFAFIKPIRVIAPELAGVTCPTEQVCVEDFHRADEAGRLYRDAVRAVQTDLSPWRKLPRVTFCGTMECYRWFGGDRDAGRTVATLGIVISPRGWKDYYVRHEMIHHWQAEQVGSLMHWRLPEWLREGMAYDLSGDPRETLQEPFETHRRRFRDWNAQRGDRDLTEALRATR